MGGFFLCSHCFSSETVTNILDAKKKKKKPPSRYWACHIQMGKRKGKQKEKEKERLGSQLKSVIRKI